MAKVKESLDEGVHPDTSAHAKGVYTGKYGDRQDRLHVPGEGFYFSEHALHDMERAEGAQAEKRGGRRYDKRYSKAFLSEDAVENLYNQIQVHRSLEAAKDRMEQQRANYESTCYDGTDTEDPTKSDGVIHDKRNAMWIDRSQSTARMSLASGTRYLNGSAVEHQHYVRFTITSPDGRTLVEVAMTFDQLASFLVSNMATPCTVDTYWSVNDQCVRLQEVVHPPETIHTRMEQRLNDRLDEMQKRLCDISTDLDAQIESGKPMSKTRLAELRKSLPRTSPETETSLWSRRRKRSRRSSSRQQRPSRGRTS